MKDERPEAGDRRQIGPREIALGFLYVMLIGGCGFLWFGEDYVTATLAPFWQWALIIAFFGLLVLTVFVQDSYEEWSNRKAVDRVIEQSRTREQSWTASIEGPPELRAEVSKLTRQEVDAVAQMLRAEFERSEKRGLWTDIAINVVFFVLGIVVSTIVSGLL